MHDLQGQGPALSRGQVPAKDPALGQGAIKKKQCRVKHCGNTKVNGSQRKSRREIVILFDWLRQPKTV